VAGIQSARAFVLGGPIGNAADNWQTPVIGYGLAGDILAPKQMGQEYRWNLPVVYYAYDQNFIEYFRSNGMVEVDKAFAILNSTFTNNPNGIALGLDGYSSDLSEFPLQSEEINYTAQALGLLDLKSLTLGLMVEGLGLGEPERYVWTLRARDHITPGPPCPDNMNYLVIQRNYDPVTDSESSYVNDTLYSYIIEEFCTGPNPLAFAAPFPVDPLAPTLTAVASFNWQLGGYYTGLTRDDVGGLRYMLSTNNLKIETPGTGETIFTYVTNTLPSLTTLDLSTFLNLLPNTDPTTLLGLYPNLVITSVTTNYFITNSSTTFLFVTNYPWLPAGFGQVIVQANQTSQIVGTNYSYTFANVVTNHFFTNWPTIFSVSNLTFSPFSVPPNFILVYKKVSSTKVLGPGGDFYILPPNVVGYILGNQVITNKGSSNVIGQIISIDSTHVEFADTTFFFTNYTYVNVKVIQLVPAGGNPTDIYQGIEKITFVRRDFDNLIGRTWVAATNNYSINSIGGNTVIPHPVQRVVTQPDILFTAQDIPPSDISGFLSPFTSSRSINFDQANILNNEAGPGTIQPQKVITFNTEAPVYYNDSVIFGLGQQPLPELVYGSFDGTTNAPIIYPDGSSIQDIENQVLMQITPMNLPNGTNGIAYTSGVQLTGTGGTTPYTWDIVANALPPGLVLSSDGIISGTPTTGVLTVTPFDFTVRMTDVGARSVQRDFVITIYPHP